MRLIVIPQSRVVEVWDQNLHGSKSNINRIYEGGKESQLVMPQSRIVRVQDQNLYGSESRIDQIYKAGNLRPIAMPLGRYQILISPGIDVDGNLPMVNSYDNIRGKGNNQNLNSYHPTGDKIILVREGAGAEFFNFSPLGQWEKIEKGRMCYSCLNQEVFVKPENAII